MRDPIRLAFAFVGSALLMLVFGFGITTDVEHIRYAALDLDQSPESRATSSNSRASPRYFTAKRRRARPTRRSGGFNPTTCRWCSRSRRASAETFAAAPRPNCSPGRRRDDVPRRHGRAIRPGRARHGAAETPRTGLPQGGAEHGRHRRTYMYNPTFESVYSIVPSVPALLLLLIPAILMTVSIVREKELGSMINFYVTPTGRLEYLIGKQIPYVAIGMMNFFILPRWR